MYLGLGVASRAVAVALADLGWDVPVVANSALMFGYARPDWRDGWAGWEYLDGVADDNQMRARLREQSKRAARRARSAAPPTTWAGWWARRSPAPTTSPAPVSRRGWSG